MKPITLTIRGIPYGQNKARGDLPARERWSEAIVEQTSQLEPVQGECFLKVRFLLPPDMFPSDCKYGSDLSNLLRTLLDGLNRTLFRDVCGHDSCISYLQAEKTKVGSPEEASVYLEIYPVEGEDEAERACALGVSRAWAAELTDPREDIYTLADGEPVDGSR